MFQRAMTRQGPVRPPYPCTKGFHPLDSNSGNYLNEKNQYGSRCYGERTRKFDLVPWCFWPGGKAANPDALHPGKAKESSEGESSLSPRMFPGFLGPEALKLFVTPARQAEFVDISNNVISPIAGPGWSPPWLGSGANSPSVTLSWCI